MPTHTFIIYNSISQTEGLALGVDKMKKRKSSQSYPRICDGLIRNAGMYDSLFFATEDRQKKEQDQSW